MRRVAMAGLVLALAQAAAALAQMPPVIVVPPAGDAAAPRAGAAPSQPHASMPLAQVRRSATSRDIVATQSAQRTSQASPVLRVERNVGQAAGGQAPSLGSGNLGLFAPILGFAAIGGAVAAATAGGGSGGTSTAPVNTISR